MNKLLVGTVLAALLLFGCTGFGQENGGIGPASRSGGVFSGVSAAPSYADATESQGGMVIKTGTLSVLVPTGTLEDKYAKLKVLLAENGGEISAVSYGEYDTQKGYSITLKIEPKKFDGLLSELKNLGEVKSADTNLEDVTEQYTDLEVRIANLRQELEALNALYNKTDKIEDILKIRSEISSVETQLDLYEQQRLYLERQVAKSTISIYLYEEKSALDKNLLVPLGSLADVFFGAMGFGIMLLAGALGFLLPGLLIVLVLYALWRAFKGKAKKGKD